MIARKASPKGRSVRVTFQLPAESAASSVAVAGSFNDWNLSKDPMRLNARSGHWRKSISFKPGERIEFRYLVDGRHWRNEEDADGCVGTPFFSENSVLEL